MYNFRIRWTLDPSSVIGHRHRVTVELSLDTRQLKASVCDLCLFYFVHSVSVQVLTTWITKDRRNAAHRRPPAWRQAAAVALASPRAPSSV